MILCTLTPGPEITEHAFLDTRFRVAVRGVGGVEKIRLKGIAYRLRQRLWNGSWMTPCLDILFWRALLSQWICQSRTKRDHGRPTRIICPCLFSRVHEDVIKWEHFPRYWPFLRGIHQSLVDSPQRLVTRSFDIFLHLRLNKRLSKQSRRRWFETPSRLLWRHCNDSWERASVIYCIIHYISIVYKHFQNILKLSHCRLVTHIHVYTSVKLVIVGSVMVWRLTPLTHF